MPANGLVEWSGSNHRKWSCYMHKYYVTVLYILFSVQTFSLYDVGDAGLKIYHLVIAALAITVVGSVRINSRLSGVCLYLLLVLSWGLLGYMFSGVNFLYLNYIFCLITVVTVGSLFGKTEHNEIVKGLQLGAVLILIFTGVNLYLNMDSIREAHNLEVITGARASMPFLLYGGGVNLEASWIALAAAFFLRQRKSFILYIILSYVVSQALSSRAGFIATTLVLLIWLVKEFAATGGNKRLRLLRAGSILTVSICVLSLLAIYSDHLSNVNIVQRFMNVGNEPGSQGRLNMWGYIWDAFVAHPIWGYGLGNAIVAIESVGFVGADGNVHNYIFQHLLEVGLIGLGAWLALSVSIIKNKAKPELQAYFAVFFVVSLVQFRGAEVLLYFVITVLLCSQGESRVKDSRLALARGLHLPIRGLNRTALRNRT